MKPRKKYFVYDTVTKRLVARCFIYDKDRGECTAWSYPTKAAAARVCKAMTRGKKPRYKVADLYLH